MKKVPYLELCDQDHDNLCWICSAVPVVPYGACILEVIWISFQILLAIYEADKWQIYEISVHILLFCLLNYITRENIRVELSKNSHLLFNCKHSN